jgi:hypothetical protein
MCRNFQHWIGTSEKTKVLIQNLKLNLKLQNLTELKVAQCY